MAKQEFKTTTKLALKLCYLFLIICSVNSCSNNNETPEQQIHRFVTSGKEMAQSRDSEGLNNLISKHYKDENGRNSQTLLQMVTGYFWRYKNIHIFTQIKNIDFPKPTNVQLQLLVAMANLPISSIDSLLNSRARLYQFDLLLAREETEWKLINANWRPATTDDFFEN